jgi:hypothetical protein
MICVCCPECRLRFTPAASAFVESCPECDRVLQSVTNPRAVVGFRLLRLDTLPPAVTDPIAVAVSLPLPDPAGSRT